MSELLHELVAQIQLANEARGKIAEAAENDRRRAEAAASALASATARLVELVGRLIRAKATTPAERSAKAKTLARALIDEADLEAQILQAPSHPCPRRDRAIMASILLDLIDTEALPGNGAFA